MGVGVVLLAFSIIQLLGLPARPNCRTGGATQTISHQWRAACPHRHWRLRAQRAHTCFPPREGMLAHTLADKEELQTKEEV